MHTALGTPIGAATLIESLRRFALKATIVVRTAQRYPDGKAEVKPEDGSLVTATDKTVEKLLRDLNDRSLGVDFYGEEFGAYGANHRYLLVVDPIDGGRSPTGTTEVAPSSCTCTTGCSTVSSPAASAVRERASCG